FRLDVFAFRVIAARNKFAKSPFFQNHLRLTALRTDLIEHDIRFLWRFRARSKFASCLALRITRAGEELSKSSPLQRHGLSAILARFGFGILSGSFALLGRFVAGDLLRVLAFGIGGACHESSELTPLDDHWTTAFFADLVRRDLLFLEVLHVFGS